MKHRFLILLLLTAVRPVVPCAAANPADSLSLRVEAIEITGAEKTREAVILKHLSFAPGDSVDAARLAGDLQALKDTHFFKDVGVFTRPGLSRGSVIVEITVKERHWPSFYFEGGHAEFDGWYLSPLGVRFDNLLGRGNHAGVKTYMSQNTLGLTGFFANNRKLNPDLQARLSAFVYSRNSFHRVDGEMYYQDVSVTGTRVDVTPARLLPFLTVGLGIQRAVPDHFMIDLDSDDFAHHPLPAAIARGDEPSTPLRLSLVASGDSRDNGFFPTRGFWGQASADFVQELDHGAVRYPQLTLDGRFYRSFGPGTGAGRLRLAATSSETPFHDRFYLGGGYSLRGYEEYSLTPLGGGTRLGLLNMEYRLPLTRKNYPRHRWTAALFMDAGAISGTGADGAGRAYGALGLGLRVRMPFIGLLRIDAGFPLRGGESIIGFSIGNIF